MMTAYGYLVVKECYWMADSQKYDFGQYGGEWTALLEICALGAHLFKETLVSEKSKVVNIIELIGLFHN